MKFFFFIFLIFSTNILISKEEVDIFDVIERSTFQIIVFDSVRDEKKAITGGSAVFINKEDNNFFFITNAHVILKAACAVEYFLSACDDGESDEWPEEIEIYITHSELDNEYPLVDYIYWEDVDLAILKFEMYSYEADDELYDEFLKEIKPIVFSSKMLNAADTVYAAGYPSFLGNKEKYKEIFVTSGIVSGFIDEESLKETSEYDLVHDAVVKRGMSGGPLINKEGELVGINGLTEGTYLDEVTHCYFSWFCLFHFHDEYKDLNIEKFSYAVSSDALVWLAFSDPTRLLFEDPNMAGYLPKFNKETDSDLYDWLLLGTEYLKNDLDVYFE